MNSPTVTIEVASRFQQLRRKYIALRIVTCAATTLAVAVLCWSVLAIGDYLWEWPLLARRVLAAIGFAALLFFAALQVLRLLGDTTASQFVSRLEQRFDSLGQRLRTVLEAVEGKLRAPEPMLSALGHQTLGRWETASPATILPTRTATLSLGGGIVLLILACVGSLVDPDWNTALLRALGSERAYTEMEVTPGDTRLLEGSQLKLRLQLHGRTDRTVVLRYRSGEEDAWIESELLPIEGDSTHRLAAFEAALGKLKEPVEYQFITSAGNTALHRIDVQPFIQVEKFETLVTPPAYTRLEHRGFSSTEITVLAGSRVEFTLETNHPLAEAQLQVGEKQSNLEEVKSLKNNLPTKWSFELASSDSVYWHFSGKGADGTPIAPIKGRLRIRYDEQPRIEWRDPTEEIKVHMLAEVPMRAQISDDYGLTESGIVFQVGDEEEYVLKNWIQAEAEGATPESITTQMRVEELLPLESLLLSERDFITYYAYAVDNREGNPQRVETDIRYIDIQPLRQFWRELEPDPNAGAGGGGLVPQLDEIIRRQRFLINRTRRESRNQNPDATNVDLIEQLPKIERMVASQSELADLTRFLMEFLASRGNDDTESLSQAEAAMLQAVDSLTNADFASALVQEEEAGRALAEARNTIENILAKNQTPRQAAQMRAFVQQMQQKLRRTPPKTDKQLADSLEQIAKEQKRLASELEQSAVQASDPVAKISATKSTGENGLLDTTDTRAGSEATGGSEAEAAEATAINEKKAEEVKPETREQDLVERVRAIESGLSQEVKKSSLVTARIQDTIKAMDELTGKLREAAAVASDPPAADATASDATASDAAMSAEAKASARAAAAVAHEIADDLRELATHIGALSQTEPANRIAALRDLTTALSNMENEVGSSMLKAVDLREKTPQGATGAGTTGASTTVTGASGSKESEQAVDSQLAQARRTVERLGRRLDDRASTVEDVLKTPPDLGSLEANEINDRIQKFVDDNEFLEDLASSRSELGKPEEARETEEWAQSANSRASEYADAAMQLDSMYRQLVMPRTDQLRKLEATANRLSKALSQQNGGSGKSAEPQQGGKGGSVESLKRELQNGLKEAELDELLELMAGGNAEEIKSEGGGNEVDPAFHEQGNSNDPSHQFSVNNRLASGVARIQKELRSRIQELIMLEIAADRDSPVPPQYRELIDGYFRTIAGGNDASLEVNQ